MKTITKTPTTVAEYIAAAPPATRGRLRQLRATIRKIAPSAEESISYGMPAYKLNGPLVYFAAFTKHIGVYPTARGIVEFKKDLAAYEGAKGSVQFPHAKPLPLSLIARIVKFRLSQNLSASKSPAKIKVKAKAKAKRSSK